MRGIKKSRAIYRFLAEAVLIIANILHDGRFFSIHVSAHFNRSEEILRHFVVRGSPISQVMFIK